MNDVEKAQTIDRYEAAVHRVQSAIAFEIERLGENAAGADAKHLRTGINSMMAETSALARLMIAKGVFTEDEYFTAIAEAAEAEADACVARTRKRCNLPATVDFG